MTIHMNNITECSKYIVEWIASIVVLSRTAGSQREFSISKLFLCRWDTPQSTKLA
jgi:hypothetical protein